MGKTDIEWATKVWNPVTGCDKVSAGCAYCYAETLANRFWGFRKFGDIKLHWDRLDQPRHWKKPERIFVNSMSDLFHDAVTYEFWRAVVGVATDCPQHQFLILTKRPERMLEFSEGCSPTPNMWMGVSVENQKAAAERIPVLLKVPAAIRFLSVEPMLEPINLDFGDKAESGVELKWVICGGESGPGARPFNIEWARHLKAQCEAAGVAFFLKQIGSKPFWERDLVGVMSPRGYKGMFPTKSRKGGDMAEWPEDLRVREFPT